MSNLLLFLKTMFTRKLETIVEDSDLSKPIYHLYNMLDHINIEHPAYNLSKNALHMLLPPIDQCWDWSATDIDLWCNYTYKYLNLARTNVCVAVYLARLWGLASAKDTRILKHVATRFKTGQQTYTMGMPQTQWSSILK